ncbi:MAG: hypothetical protein JWQ66_2989 [Mucilaginibacter sp.]|nr:hypothetical protein [Mucilaginibacter sp.]
MKTLLKSALFAAVLFVAAQTQAKTMERDTSKVSKAAKSVGHKTSELAAKGASDVVDKKYEGKCGPHGETVYINEHSHYYYINKKGHRVYLKKSQLMDKKM